MHKQILFIGVLVVGGINLLLTSCYQKKAKKFDTHWQVEEIEEDTTIQSINPDAIAYIDTFKLVPIQLIHKQLKSNAKQSLVFKTPAFSKSDSLDTTTIIEQLAVNFTYHKLGELSKNKKLMASSKSEMSNLATLLFPDSILPKKITSDSLNSWFKQALNNNHQWIYFEAIEWLEQLYITVENPKIHKSKAKFQALVELQLENGTEMLERISMHQDFEPLALLMNDLISIIDCKYYTFNPVELKEEVVKARENCYFLPKSAK
ncbi:MAG TPA: hypothetical protein PKN38_04840, partial [Taishania sp.]|nr:hypothetical protein [Taishania sp.]